MRDAAEAVLLFAGVAVELLCCLGVLRMRVVYDRLHYLAPASFVGPLLIVLAVALRFSSLQLVLKAVAILAVLSITGPIITRVLARAARVRESQTTSPFPDEIARGSSAADDRT
jgi:multicomponent Na+:H+ antiporter subunit G